MHRSFVCGMLVVPMAVLGIAIVYAGDVTTPNTFVAGTTAVAADVNENFAAHAAAIDDNHDRIAALEAEPTRVTQAVSRTFVFTGLPADSYDLDIYVRGDADSVGVNPWEFGSVQVQVRFGRSAPVLPGHAFVFDGWYSSDGPDVTFPAAKWQNLTQWAISVGKGSDGTTPMIVTLNTTLAATSTSTPTRGEFIVCANGKPPADDGYEIVLVCD